MPCPAERALEHDLGADRPARGGDAQIARGYGDDRGVVGEQGGELLGEHQLDHAAHDADNARVSSGDPPRALGASDLSRSEVLSDDGGRGGSESDTDHVGQLSTRCPMPNAASAGVPNRVAVRVIST